MILSIQLPIILDFFLEAGTTETHSTARSSPSMSYVAMNESRLSHDSLRTAG